ncbi:DUF3784 domain-containing protein [Anaerococcus sp. AGMB00486]|uniref:DUF3784 domain-containing protein n=1 Tax=Anaerococcus faecalis TaxID=2742993 RepID=A0ABX2NCI4_9FIRM|nr:DUF3784 domain-containing protein [Anaerococcus faecalis]NVF12431.1 DUF3784 domain-containing protein [Anaerococcus faecalis]
MTILKIIIIMLGVTFSIFGYLIFFKKNYKLINNFEVDYKAGRKTESYAKKVGIIELIIGIVLTLVGLCIIIIK